MKNARPPLWKRSLVGLIALQLVIAPIEPALAQVTKLADEPIGFSPSAPPNIMLTVDDSTSMLSDFLPDYVIEAVPGASPAVGGFCRDHTGLMTSACGYAGSPTSPPFVYSSGTTAGGTNMPYPRYAIGTPPYTAQNIPDWLRAWPAPAHSNALNRLYYDPSITYTPPLRYDGTSYPSQNAANTANWTKVIADPWVDPPANARYENLTTSVRVGMWCNSDWPTNTDPDPTSAGGIGGGTECRINGTDYSMTPPTGPAANHSDYMYPWRKTSGANDPKYFFWGRNINTSGNYTSGVGTTWNKVLWCDTTHPKYPKTCPATPMVCPVATVPGTPQPQTCFYQGDQTGCVIPASFNPPGCNVPTPGTKYGAPGCTAAGCCTGPECVPCQTVACTTGVTGKLGRCRLASSSPPGSGGSNSACNCSGVGCTLPSCPNYTPPATCPVPLVPGTPPACTNASANCNTRLFNEVTRANDLITLLQDADGPGEVCRHNNQSYPDGTVASPFNYPSGKYTTPISNSCPTVPSSALIPRHYWKVSVEWCTTKITAANDKWRGFGLAGTCQDEHDIAHPYPRFYKWGVRKTDPEYLDNYTYPAFQRVDLTPSITTYNHPHYNRLGQLVNLTRTYAEEMENYANWFSYYRTRILAAKTTISQNFTFLDDTYRVGFHTLSNDPPTSFVKVDDFDDAPGGQKDQWYTQLFGIQIAMGKQTPNIDAVVRIGELFKTGTSAQLSGATDPITLSCQKNYHMLFTDGITNQPALPATTVGNVDDIVPTLPVPLVVTPPIVAGQPWPSLYRENTAASLANTLGDYAMHYWVTDLRPAMTNNVVTGRDPAPWQHLNFAALSLGAEGQLAGASPASVESQIASGAVKWPTPTPNQYQPNATGVDDLWHAAVNARGRFVNAKTSQQLGRGIAGILQDITSPSGSAAPPTFANPNITATNNYTYIAKFEQGWGGTVQKVQIDPVTAAPQSVIWDAKTQLITQTTPDASNPSPWFTRRRIVTMNEAGAPVPFLWGSLDAGQRDTLGPDSTHQQSVVEYLRGRRDREGEDEGQFRVRVSPLGDIVDSQGVLVGPTSAPVNDYWDYTDAKDPGYSAFRTSQATRPGRIYVGANDGMLHVFDEATGDEVWAFVPPDFYRSAPPISNDKAGLIGLTYQPGGLPIYDHRFYVNATPRVVDVDIGGTWKTLLVHGLGKGGKSYYAIDATDPQTVTDEASAASKVMWRFTDPDLGYTYGRATIVKTRAYGWTVIVPSGYNNASGEGKIFFLNPADGTQLRPPMSTATGTPASPSGLAHIAGYVKDYRDQTVEQVYGGDLFGNVWRFDLSDPDPSNWQVKLFAKLTDSGGTPQPITTPPRIDVDIANGIDRWVFVGTGRLLHIDDLPSTQQQRMYAMRDGTYLTPTPHGDPTLTPSDLVEVSGIAGLGANVIATKGWYDDLPPGQRIVRTPVAAVGLIAYISTSQPTDPCEVGLPANIYVRQFGNGESRLDAGGTIVEYIYEPTGAAGLDVIAMNPPGCTANCIPDIKLAVLSSSTSQLITFKAKLPTIVGERRMSWGQLGQ